jgi:aldehyde dehydrogenase (NAD+)
MTENDNNGITQALQELGLKRINNGICTGTKWYTAKGDRLDSYSPADGEVIGMVNQANKLDYEKVMKSAAGAFSAWRMVPAPRRGDIVRQMGNEFRKYKEPLGKLVSYETGKIYQEGLGEVQEVIDICDFSLGLSRQLYGFTMHSERSRHRMYEQWHPLGIVGIISAFNFPVAVWAWNAMLSLVCGDTVIWKPSEKVPLCAIACHNIVSEVLDRNDVPEGVLNLITGDFRIGELICNDKRIPLISATGSTKMGITVGMSVAKRLGRSLLELGGNNAVIITEHADLDMTLRAVLFGAAGTAGQRCTTTRRLIVKDTIYNSFMEKLAKMYSQLSVGHPLKKETMVGPLIDKQAVRAFEEALKEVKAEGGKIVCGGEVLSGKGFDSGCYVKPCIVEAKNNFKKVQEETFAPILYIMKYSSLDEAIEMHNNVPQGLSSSIFSRNMMETEKFLSHEGSDCGIANVNIGTSGAEIGGAFGGEKETGGGRESGSDAWKAYMRRQTNTINYGTDLPLAQGIKFQV